MAELSMAEFVDELVAELEDRIEGHLTGAESAQLRGLLRASIARIDKEETTTDGD